MITKEETAIYLISCFASIIKSIKERNNLKDFIFTLIYFKFLIEC